MPGKAELRGLDYFIQPHRRAWIHRPHDTVWRLLRTKNGQRVGMIAVAKELAYPQRYVSCIKCHETQNVNGLQAHFGRGLCLSFSSAPDHDLCEKCGRRWCKDKPDKCDERYRWWMGIGYLYPSGVTGKVDDKSGITGTVQK